MTCADGDLVEIAEAGMPKDKPAIHHSDERLTGGNSRRIAINGNDANIRSTEKGARVTASAECAVDEDLAGLRPERLNNRLEENGNVPGRSAIGG
jgi:hypothetical protein